MKFADKTPIPFGKMILDMAIPTLLSYKMPIVYRIVNELLKNDCLDPAKRPGIELALDEAISNSMLHGNKLDSNKKVRVRICYDAERWAVLLDDEGAGFSASELPKPDDPEALFRESGRGIILMDVNLDEVIYSPKGNTVMLVNRRSTIQKAESVEPSPIEEPAVMVEAHAEPVRTEPIDFTEPTTTVSDGPIVIVTLNAARISHDNLDPMREALNNAANNSNAVVVDLQHVVYISSAVIGTLMKTYRQVKSKKGWFAVANPQDPLLAILKAVSLDRVFEVYPNTVTAVAALKQKLR